MADLEIGFTPHNDLHPDDISLVKEHENLIKENKFSDATALLDNADYQKGFRASLFNSMEQKIRSIQEYLLNKVIAEPDEYYSYSEPTEEQMKNKTYWVQIF